MLAAVNAYEIRVSIREQVAHTDAPIRQAALLHLSPFAGTHMLTAPTSESTRATLQYVLTSEIPGEHKSVLIGLLTQALRDLDAARVRSSAGAPPEPWRSDEIDTVQAFLVGKTANSWQHADELLMHLVTQLKRSPQDVRCKATALGYAAGVDYSIARARPRPEQMPTTRGGLR